MYNILLCAKHCYVLKINDLTCIDQYFTYLATFQHLPAVILFEVRVPMPVTYPISCIAR